MSEQDLRDGLEAAVSEEPPLSFDPDALMVKAAREVKRRRALIGASVATVAVAVAAVAVPTLLGNRPGGSVGSSPEPGNNEAPAAPCVPPSWYPSDLTIPPPAPGEPTPTYKVVIPPTAEGKPSGLLVPAESLQPPQPADPSGQKGREVVVLTAYACPPPSGLPTAGPPSVAPVPSGPARPDLKIAWPPPGITPAHYTADELKRRGAEMQQYLRTRFPTVVPDAKDVSPGAFGGEADGAVADGQSYLNGFTTFTVNGARAAVDISAFAPAADAQGPEQRCAELPDAGCKLVPQSDGSNALVFLEKLDNGASGLMVITVIHYRNNGSIVSAAGYNYDPTASVPPTYLPEIPVTVEQLTALATDPELGL